MALTEKTVIGEIRTYPETGIISVATDTIVERDGVEDRDLRKRHRHTIAPGQDYSNEAPEVQVECELRHTPEVIAAYQARLTEEEV